MRIKLRAKQGFTLSEMLVATAIVALIGMALAVGIPTALRVQRAAAVSSEASALCSTLTTALADELRYVSSITQDGSDIVFDSPTYGLGVFVTSTDERIRIGGYELVSELVYTSGLTATATITYEDSLLHIDLQIYDAEIPNPRATAVFDLQPLNP